MPEAVGCCCACIMQLQVATTIGADLAARVIDVCAEQLDQFATTYKRESLLPLPALSHCRPISLNLFFFLY